MLPYFTLSYWRRAGGYLRRKLRRALTNVGKVNADNRGVFRLIDVGAIGDLPEPWFQNAHYVKTLLRFEPRENTGTDPNVITLGVALGSKNEKRSFHIYEGNQSHGSSFYEQNIGYVTANFEQLRLLGPPEHARTWHERARLVKTIQLDCKTLDTVLDDLGLDFHFDFLKVDAQGAEYEILVGGERFLKTDCLGMQLELFSIPMYKGISLKDEVVHALNGKGFELVKEFPPHGTFNGASDCVFFRRDYPPGAQQKMNLLRQIYNV